MLHTVAYAMNKRTPSHSSKRNGFRNIEFATYFFRFKKKTLIVPMEYQENAALHELLRMAVSDSPCIFTHKLSAKEWNELHSVCIKQLLSAVVYRAICRLPKEQQPPLELAFQWASEAETVKGHNKLLNAMAAKYTEQFATQNRKTAILKGSANARLYPDPFMRQAGDIDLWVEGGRKSVIALLKEMKFEFDEKEIIAPHHVHIQKAENDITLEIHFRPSSGNLNPFSSRRLLCFLENEIQNVEHVPEGFNVPSIKFALAMQLAHIQRHFFSGGIGFKQLVDYYILLQHASEEERQEISGKLSSFGLLKLCSALMWIMDYVFKLDPEKMLCKPNEKLGKKLLAEVYRGGHFGKYGHSGLPDIYRNAIVRWLKYKWRRIRLFWFSPSEVLLGEIGYWFTFIIGTIPLRIKKRRFALSETKKLNRTQEKSNGETFF